MNHAIFKMEHLKFLITDYIDNKPMLEALCKNHRFTVNNDYLEGVKQGLITALKMLNLIEIETI